ncbi:MAG TPA: glycosyltransferase [Candidatus Sulfotelmatobacter sp.]|nr:glycosyltransferase [Candidatus Sulfotelmatobacter sp.]
MANISIGVYVHAEPERLKATLASLRAHTEAEHDLLLLGDGPDEETGAALLTMSGISQSNTGEPKGTAACFNRLLRRRSAPIFVLLESGTEVAPGWLEALLVATQRYPKCGLAGPSTNRAWNQQCIFPTARDETDEVSRIAIVAARRFGATCRTLEPLHTLADFCYLVRREVVDAIGEADEGYGLGPCWEMDYNIRAARAGFQALWACSSYVHRAPFTTRRQHEESDRFGASKHLYQDKFCGLRLRGLKNDYRSHCRGGACPNFAPANLIALRHPSVENEPRPVPHPAATVTDWPLVSCIMPTYNRRAFIERSLEYFFRQDYPRLELILVDDGADPIADLLPMDPRIRYHRLPERRTVGEKRNYANQLARGRFICHWDDDDWYSASRVRRQITPLLEGKAQVSGTSTLYFYNHDKNQAFRYQYRANRPWVAGNTLVYSKSLWERRPFEPIQIAEDVKFIAPLAADLICDLKDLELCIGSIHGANVSPKITSGAFWTPEPAEKIRAIFQREPAPGERDARIEHALPLVSCIMPTYNRRPFIPLSLSCFQAQTYPNRELIVVDDGADPVADLLQGDPQVRHIRLDRRLSIGAKRNIACEQARGLFIAHWDDDDWYAPQRLAAQLQPLLTDTHDLTGLINSYVLQMPDGRFWTTSEAVHRRMFVGDMHGGTLVYRRSLWLNGIRYPETSLAEDAMFIRRASETRKRLLRLSNPGLFIYLRHGQNTWKFDSGRFLDPAGWRSVAAPSGFAPDLLDAYRRAVCATAAA